MTLLVKKLIAILALAPGLAFAAEGSFPLDRAPDRADLASLQNGAKLFVNHCLNCHSAASMRYNRLRDLGLTDDQIRQNLLFSADKVGDMMTTAMRPNDAKAWFGAEVPDLTLITRVRGSEWLYAYLHGFYADPARPWGVNNIVYPNVGMPNVLESLQGRQVLDCPEPAVQPCTRLRVIPGTGSLDARQFDDKVRNLVAFLAYSADPVQTKSRQIGLYVLLYLALLILLAYLLKREYWKDVR